MITLETITYDVRHLLEKLGRYDQINDLHIQEKIIGFIELYKKKIYDERKSVNPAWILNLGRVDVLASNSGDNLGTPNGSVVFSKYTLPRPISFNGIPFVKVYSGLRTVEFTRINSFDLFYQIYRGDREVLERNPVYIFENNTVYGYPFKQGLNISFAPADPRDCYIRKALTPPYGNVIYTDTQLRKFTIWDEFPVDSDIAQMVVNDIANKEFPAHKQDIPDTTQNATAEV